MRASAAAGRGCLLGATPVKTGLHGIIFGIRLDILKRLEDLALEGIWPGHIMRVGG